MMKPYFTCQYGDLYCGDCLEVMPDLAKNGVKVDMVLTDPPYLMSYKTNYRKDKKHVFCSTIYGDDDFNLIEMSIALLQTLMKDHTFGFVFCNCTHIDFFKAKIECLFNLKNIIVWVKNNHTAGDLRGSFGRRYENILMFSKGRPSIRGKRFTDVWEFDRIAGKNQVHQNEKPVPLLTRAITSCSDVSSLILDPFLGSGTTAVAAVNTGRRFVGIEREEKYCEIAAKRILGVL